MRRYIIAIATLSAAAALNAQEYRTARIVDAGQSTELRAGGLFGGAVNDANVNMLTVEMDGMRFTAEYQTMFAGGKNASSRFVVGSEIQARVDKDKWLWIAREDAKPLRVRIVRREMIRSSSP